ncbi:hypothetical protein DGMP_20190 [Desulfomarina profundi]|uniref:Uncharacterized protein n=1 Tax=Desulfomarina profundi TaxID=2772557 RepID=A0A8D5JRR5_9BACT|nr:hypothetical protein [Desulfomarina profundi]BCL61326.1 hypothetical protein DGMP_20190 [Desulfomarina profundi]
MMQHIACFFQKNQLKLKSVLSYSRKNTSPFTDKSAQRDGSNRQSGKTIRYIEGNAISDRENQPIKYRDHSQLRVAKINDGK